MTYTVENGIIYASDGVGKCCIGAELQPRVLSDTETETTYQWQRWDPESCAYVDDTTNSTPIQGATPANGQVVVPKLTPAAPPLTMEDIYQNQLAIMDGMTDLYTKIGGTT